MRQLERGRRMKKVKFLSFNEVSALLVVRVRRHVSVTVWSLRDFGLFWVLCCDESLSKEVSFIQALLPHLRVTEVRRLGVHLDLEHALIQGLKAIHQVRQKSLDRGWRIIETLTYPASSLWLNLRCTRANTVHRNRTGVVVISIIGHASGQALTRVEGCEERIGVDCKVRRR